MKRIIPDFKMSIANLCMYVSNLTNSMKKDETLFAARGVSMADILALEALGNAYEVYPPDEFYLGYVMIAVEVKNNEKEMAYIIAREITGYFIQAYDVGSEKYKRIYADKFANSNDNTFVSLMRDLARIAEELLPELSAIGLTQSKIDSLASATDSLELKVDAVADAKAVRREKTRERIKNGNEIYSFVTKYTTIGKLLAEEHPEVNYKTYLIYRYKKRKKRSE